MNREQAKRLLLACRPKSPDRQDPEVAQALDLAEKDPTLQLWLNQQAAFHDELRTALRRVPVPAGLKDKILSQPKIITPVWRRPEWMLLAACLGLALILAGLWVGRSSTEQSFATYRARMVSSALRSYQMDIVTNDLNQVRHFLRAQGAPADYTLSPALQSIPVKGGARLWWQGHPVSMVCFALPKDETLYLFVLDETAIPRDQRPGKNPALKAVRGQMTASWQRAGKVYLMAAADSAILQRMLGAKLDLHDPPGLLIGIIVGTGPAS